MPYMGEARLFLRRLWRLAAVVAVLLLLGMIGFAITEHENPWDALVRTLDTVATVGAIPAPHDTGGEVLRVALIILGVGTLFYALVTVTEFFVHGHLGQLLASRRAQRMIESFSDHYLICGFGRVGRQVARDLGVAGGRYVIIDETPENREVAEAMGVGDQFLEGQPSDDEILKAAGIMRAKAVLACVDSDAENIFIALSARGLRPDVRIVARASAEDSEQKLNRAGADRVISPYKASGAEMARLALHPHVSGVVEMAHEYRMEEIEVRPGSQGEGKSIGDVRGGAFIVALRGADATFQVQPSGDTILRAGDVLVAMGTLRTVQRLEQLFESASTPSRAT
jgi:voltage-gated potassium channel